MFGDFKGIKRNTVEPILRLQLLNKDESPTSLLPVESFVSSGSSCVSHAWAKLFSCSGEKSERRRIHAQGLGRFEYGWLVFCVIWIPTSSALGVP